MRLQIKLAGWSLLTCALLAVAAMAVAGPGLSAAEAMKATSVSTRIESVVHRLQTSKSNSFTLIEYAVPTKDAVPHILAIDSGDRVWFSESGGGFAKNFIDSAAQSKIGRLDQAGSVSEWVLPGEGTSPMGILFDNAGNLWITERLANRLTKMSASGETRSYPLPTPDAWPTGIAMDQQGRIWFTETKGDKIGYLDPASDRLEEFQIPARRTMSTGIAVDRKGIVWVAERDVDMIGRFDPASRTFTQFATPTRNAKPCGLLVDNDGQVWFSERNGGKIARISPEGQILEFPMPDRFSGPFLMVADKKNQLWFSEIFSSRIGRFDPATGAVEYYPLPSHDAHPAGLALDSKGNVWFAEQSVDKIGVIVRTDLSYIGTEQPKAKPVKANAAPGAHTIDEFEIPTPQSIPGIVGVGADDVVWFTEMGGGFVGPGFPPGAPGSSVGYIKDDVVHELPMPTRESGPTSLAKDPCSSDIWITLRAANRIARIRDFQVTEYEIPVPDSLPVGITVDRNHNVWVALSNANKIGRRTPEGHWKFLDVPEPDAQPRTIFADSQNQIWFAEKTGNHVGWVDQEQWRLERWKIPTRLAWPLSLEEDDKGNLWFAEMRGDKIAMLDRQTKAISEYPLPIKSAPFKIVFDQKNSAFWVSTVFADSILRFDYATRQMVQAYRVPSEGAWVGGLDKDAQDCIWFSEQFANKVGRLCIEGIAKRPVKVQTTQSLPSQ
jgi:virginiamycin B lyase